MMIEEMFRSRPPKRLQGEALSELLTGTQQASMFEPDAFDLPAETEVNPDATDPEQNRLALEQLLLFEHIQMQKRSRKMQGGMP